MTEITKGLLDALVLTPIGDENGVRFLAVEIRDMPGLRMSIQFEAVQELRRALDIILGPLS